MHYSYFIKEHHDGCHAGEVLEQFYVDADPLIGFSCIECDKVYYDEDEELAKILIEAHIVHEHNKDLMERMEEDD